MKKRIAFLLVTAMLLLQTAALAAGPITEDGYFNDILLTGRVRVVTHDADIKVQVVDFYPDLRVKRVRNVSDKIGEWKFVRSDEDFTIQYVHSFPDIKIKFVSCYPGIE